MGNPQLAGSHLLYWTGEPKKEHALMSFLYRPDIVEQAGIHFTITKPPELKVCKECDLRGFCDSQGAIKPKERGL
jgi:hypothetical protein